MPGSSRDIFVRFLENDVLGGILGGSLLMFFVVVVCSSFSSNFVKVELCLSLSSFSSPLCSSVSELACTGVGFGDGGSG